jgi:tetratricopeptide (TPR) repeat protein
VLTSARSIRPRTLIGVGNPTLRPRTDEPRPAAPAGPAPRASLPQEPVSWRDATLLQGLAPPPENDQGARASLPTSAAAKAAPRPSPAVATPPDENDVPTASGALEPAAHEAAFLAMARAEAESVRALDDVLHSNRVSETSLAPAAPRSLRFAKPLAGALAAVLVTLGGLALWGAPKSAPLRTHAAEPRTKASPLSSPAAPDPSLAVRAAEPSPAPAPNAAAAPEAVVAVAPTAEPVPSAELTARAAPAETDDGDAAEEDDEAADSAAELAPNETSSSDAIGRAKGLARQGKLLLRKGRTSQAKEAFEGALLLVPAQTRALSALAKLGLKEHDAEAALRYASTLAKLRPKSASALLMLGDAQKLAGDTTSAIATWQRAAQRGSRPARARLEE